MKKYKISTLIKAILIVFCLSIVVVSAFSFNSMRYAVSAFENMRKVTNNARELYAASQSLAFVRGDINYLYNDPTVTHEKYDREVVLLKKNLAAAKAAIDRYIDATELDDEGLKLSKRIEVSFTALYNIYNGNITSLEHYVNSGFDNGRYEVALDNDFNNYNSYSKKLESDVAYKFSAHNRLFWIVSCVFFALAVVIAYIGWFLIKNSVFKRLEYASTSLQEISGGTLYNKINIGPKNEIGIMLESLEQMRNSLLEIIISVRGTSESINNNASEIDSSNQELASRTEEQASALQQTAASMEEIKTTVSNTTEHAREANELASSAKSIAENGSEVMNDVVTTMDKISQSAKKIHEINNVIDGIANQTNILALNAAVEAARAGEQGRGFSVVATEVRNLAKRSADAAKEISVLISQAVENVDDGARQVKNAGNTMHEIVASVTHVSNIMKEITQASEEQSSGVGQITTAVNEMDLATQQNATMVEESAAIALNMSASAQELHDTIVVFRLNPTDASHSAAISAGVKQVHRAAKSQSENTTQQSPANDLIKVTEEDNWSEF